MGFKFVAVDTEGFAPDLLGISIAHPGLDSMYFPIGHREDVNIDEETKEYLYHVLKTVYCRIMHNAGHDLVALPMLLDLRFADTMIIGHMVDENVMSKSLDWLHKTYCNGEGKEIHPLMESIIKTLGWYHVPYALMYDYGRVDAKITMELFLKLRPLYEEQFGPLFEDLPILEKT